MKVNAIAAMGQNRQIGLKGKLPWNDPAEMLHFQLNTNGHILIMGRKTFESIKKPLTNRQTIVVSKKSGKNNKSTFFVKSPEEAIELAKFIKSSGDFRQVWVCGGAKIYEALMPHITTFILSIMDYDGEADSYLPEFEKDFHCSCVLHNRGDKFKIYTYERVK